MLEPVLGNGTIEKILANSHLLPLIIRRNVCLKCNLEFFKLARH